jgi:hypothetical protein
MLAEKQGSDIYNGKRVHDISGLEHVAIEVVVTEVAHNEPPSIQALVFKETRTFRERVDAIEARATFHKMHLNPDFDESSFAITDEIPEGMEVSVEDAPHIDFVWSDGKIVKHERVAISDLEGQVFKAGSRKYFALISINLVALAVGGLLWRRRRRQGPQAGTRNEP